ncbi:sulfurtransferase-like selenium metabolism protein YedF [Heliobacterium gestii]|uniref:Sulfurtransferase-like selenium metabolism protein YedF n=1 Tax=Heliomicrobium gestii TaxID=2699 RepID=A0A845LDC2_HELGE|nr:sulfurtransferase-like selenium metabolism protein YedF [Heliomicrobium gestii]MBM7867795.1 selenium metabolism protein YedF [Heliomicrobium gestii]MZP44188.1 sulfurtransferase-like selenium metabolism protein YedF [Heliomicrobium gestii]
MSKETGAAARPEAPVMGKDLSGLSTAFALPENSVLLMTADRIGRGDDELGRVLVKSFLYTLSQADVIPKTIIFLNSGVHLPCEDSETLQSLLALEERGVEILSCGTCLDFYKQKEKLVAGKVSNMYAIVDMLTRSTHVVTL